MKRCYIVALKQVDFLDMSFEASLVLIYALVFHRASPWQTISYLSRLTLKSTMSTS